MLERKFALKYFRVLLNKRFASAACFTVLYLTMTVTMNDDGRRRPTTPTTSTTNHNTAYQGEWKTTMMA